MTKAKRTTGLCTICGDASNPKGNVFTIVRTYEFIFEGAPRYREQAPRHGMGEGLQQLPIPASLSSS